MQPPNRSMRGAKKLQAVRASHVYAVNRRRLSLTGRTGSHPESRCGMSSAFHVRRDSMFLIAGVQPKTVRLSDQPQRCPSCGLNQAYATRLDHYLSLFFIPLIRVRSGEAFLLCEHCQRSVDPGPAPAPTPLSAGVDTVCVACNRTFDRSFKYCPHCGQRA